MIPPAPGSSPVTQQHPAQQPSGGGLRVRTQDSAALGEVVSNTRDRVSVGMLKALVADKGPAVLTSTKDSKGNSFLHWAAVEGNLPVARFLVEDHKIDPNCKAKDLTTPLMYAVNHGQKAMVVWLVHHVGKGISYYNSSGGLTPLHIAVQTKSVDLARFLLENGANVRALTARGQTPLMIASFLGHVPMVRALLEFEGGGGARLNAKDAQGNTALHLCTRGMVAQMLLDAGGDASALNNAGRTPEQAMRLAGHSSMAYGMWSFGRFGTRVDTFDLNRMSQSGGGGRRSINWAVVSIWAGLAVNWYSCAFVLGPLVSPPAWYLVLGANVTLALLCLRICLVDPGYLARGPRERLLDLVLDAGGGLAQPLQDVGPPQSASLCIACNAVRQPRTHHCGACDRCVIEMDHHCVWVHNCIGVRNHREFVWFSLIIVGFGSFTTPVEFLHMLRRAPADPAAAADSLLPSALHTLCEAVKFSPDLMLIILLSTFFIIFLSMLSLGQLRQISLGTTTVDWDRVAKAGKKGGPGARAAAKAAVAKMCDVPLAKRVENVLIFLLFLRKRKRSAM